MSYNELKQRGTEDFPIEIYCIDKDDLRYEMVSHWHSEIEILRVLKGCLEVKLNSNTYKAQAGDIVFVNPSVVHGALPYDCAYECVDFDINYLSVMCDGCRYFFDGVANGEYVITEHITNGEEAVKKAANSVFEAMKNKSSGYKFKVIGALYELFGEIVEGHKYSHISGEVYVPDKNVMKLKKVLKFMRENYDKQITLNDMAASASMSPKYFCYFFKEMTRHTPVEYLNFYRIEKASRMLLNTDISVTEIAFLCGFNDLSYFIKTFKGHKNGITPAKYRKVE